MLFTPSVTEEKFFAQIPRWGKDYHPSSRLPQNPINGFKSATVDNNWKRTADLHLAAANPTHSDIRITLAAQPGTAPRNSAGRRAALDRNESLDSQPQPAQSDIMTQKGSRKDLPRWPSQHATPAAAPGKRWPSDWVPSQDESHTRRRLWLYRIYWKRMRAWNACGDELHGNEGPEVVIIVSGGGGRGWETKWIISLVKEVVRNSSRDQLDACHFDLPLKPINQSFTLNLPSCWIFMARRTLMPWFYLPTENLVEVGHVIDVPQARNYKA